MELQFKSNPDRYVFLCTFDEKEIAKQARFRWSPDRKEWWSDNKGNAAKLASFASDPELKAELTALNDKNLATRRDAVAASKATDAAIDIPAPEGCEYLPYQKAGVAFAIRRFEQLGDKTGGVMFGDEMGLGKTIQAIGIINATPEIKTVCVVCPASLKLNWQRELRKWLVRPFSIGIGDSKGVPDTEIVICNYESLFEDDPEAIAHNVRVPRKDRKPTVRLRHLSLARTFDLLIVDESHRLKNGEAKRTQAVEAIRARRVAYLTGTPIPNRHKELWNTLLRLDPVNWTYTTKAGDVRPGFWSFGNRYCGGQNNGWALSTNGEELQERMRTSFLVRRLKAEVLTELPAKRRAIVELTPNGAARDIADNASRIEQRNAELDEARARIELAKAADDAQAYEEAVSKLRAAKGIAFTEMARVRHDEAVAMIPQAIEYLETALEDRAHKVVVFAWHHEVIQAIASAFQDRTVVVYGETKIEDRDSAVQAFQNNPDVQLFVGSITAAGVGLTLTAASHVIFVEEDWVPGNITQAEDRCHRIGQRDSVLVEHLVFNGSISAKMIKICVAKQEIADRALDSVIEVEDESIQVPSGNKPATANVKREQLVKEAAAMAPRMIEDVHTALKILAGSCDWANAIDNVGFNKIDALLGHSLADAPQLSAKQAVLGRKIIRKYKRQLSGDLYERIFGTAE